MLIKFPHLPGADLTFFTFRSGNGRYLETVKKYHD